MLVGPSIGYNASSLQLHFVHLQTHAHLRVKGHHIICTDRWPCNNIFLILLIKYDAVMNRQKIQ